MGSYLKYLQEKRAWKENIKKKKISSDNIKKIEQLKSREEEIRGISKGNQAIIQQFKNLFKSWGKPQYFDIKFDNKIENANLRQIGKQFIISLPTFKSSKAPNMKYYKESIALQLRHELEELKSMFRNVSSVNRRGVAFYKGFEKVGAHHSPEVLRREKEYVDFLNNSFNKPSSFEKKMKYVRTQNKEYELVEDMKRRAARKIEKLAAKHELQNDISKVDKAKNILSKLKNVKTMNSLKDLLKTELPKLSKNFIVRL